MPMIVEKLLRVCLSGCFVGIPLVIVLWLAQQKRIASVATLICGMLAGLIALAFLAGLPELFGLLPTGTFFFPEGYRFQMNPHPIKLHMMWLVFATAEMLCMYGIWSLRKA